MEDTPDSPAQTPWIRRVDDAVFRAEQTLVASFLASMTVMVFLDVVYRRLTDTKSKLGGALAGLFDLDDATRASLDQTVIPPFYAVLGVALLWLCFRSAERERSSLWFGRRLGALLLSLATAAVLAALGWMMLHVSSAAVYASLGGLAAAGYSYACLRAEGPAPTARIAGTWLAAGLFGAVAWTQFPQGYSWSKEVSLMLLLWVGFVGASVCVHEGKHLRMEAAALLVPEPARRYVGALGALTGAGFTGFMTLLGYNYVFDPIYGSRAIGGVFEQTGIPDWVATVAVPVAFGLTTLRFIGVAISLLRGGNYGALAAAEGIQEAEALAEETS